LQTSSVNGLLAEPEKILKRLSSLNREERFFSVAAFVEAGTAGVKMKSAGCLFGSPAAWAVVEPLSLELGTGTAVVSFEFTLETLQAG
jgi:hypothetical protein